MAAQGGQFSTASAEPPTLPYSILTNDEVCAVKPAHRISAWWLLPAIGIGALGAFKGYLQIQVSQEHWAIYTHCILDFLVVFALAILPEGTPRIVVKFVGDTGV